MVAESCCVTIVLADTGGKYVNYRIEVQKN